MFDDLDGIRTIDADYAGHASLHTREGMVINVWDEAGVVRQPRRFRRRVQGRLTACSATRVGRGDKRKHSSGALLFDRSRPRQ